MDHLDCLDPLDHLVKRYDEVDHVICSHDTFIQGPAGTEPGEVGASGAPGDQVILLCSHVIV